MFYISQEKSETFDKRNTLSLKSPLKQTKTFIDEFLKMLFMVFSPGFVFFFMAASRLQFASKRKTAVEISTSSQNNTSDRARTLSCLPFIYEVLTCLFAFFSDCPNWRQFKWLWQSDSVNCKKETTDFIGEILIF